MMAPVSHDDIDLSGTRADPGRPGTPEKPGGDSRRVAWIAVAVVAAALLITWVLRNGRTVRVDWLVGSTDAALAVVILVALALGWVLGVATAMIVRRRRARRRRD